MNAARLRFRPIIMTALAFIFGCVPLWVAQGAGSVSRRILGTVVVGGMTLSSVIGILFIPVTFAFVEYVSHRYSKGGKGTSMDSKLDHQDPSAGELVTSQSSGGHALRRLSNRLILSAACAGSLLVFSGCTVGPKYARPQVPIRLLSVAPMTKLHLAMRKTR